LIKPFRNLVIDENLAALPEAGRDEIKKALETMEKKRDQKMKELLKANEARVQVKEEDLIKRFPVMAVGYRSLQEALQRREKERPAPLPQLAALTETTNSPPEHHVLIRGNYARPGPVAEPGVPLILCSGQNSYHVPASSTPRSSGRRTALADWLISPEHPTVARMMVNRIWQRHFGVGLVSTPENFGVTGAKPTHPELLDFLATEFVRSGWSIKSMHRLIVNSATYRQSSGGAETRATEPESKTALRGTAAAKAMRADPDDRLLWRFPLTRLDAESIRDAMLCASGEIDLSLGGSYVATDKTEEGQCIVNEQTNPGYKRRSLYLQQKRARPLTLLDVFDTAQMNPNCTRRNTSTISLQSLALLNSDFVRNRSRALAERLAKDAGAEEERRLDLGFALALGRKPKAAELAASRKFLRTQPAEYTGKADAELRVWTGLCQMLFASNSFLYVE
jgi:hypothetical protein